MFDLFANNYPFNSTRIAAEIVIITMIVFIGHHLSCTGQADFEHSNSNFRQHENCDHGCSLASVIHRPISLPVVRCC